MHQLNVTREIDASPDQVWGLLDNFADTWIYHPIVAQSESLGGQKTGLGAKRRCTMYDGKQVEECITRYAPEERSYEVTVTDAGRLPLDEMVLSITVYEGAEGHARVEMVGHMQPKYGPVGWLMAKLMMKRQFEKLLAQLIEGMEAHLKTGRVVEEGGRLGTPASRTRVKMA